MRVVGDTWVLWQWSPGLPRAWPAVETCLRCVDAEGSTVCNLYDPRCYFLLELSWGGVSKLICGWVSESIWIGGLSGLVHIASI